MPRRYKESARLVDGHSDGITAVAFSLKGDILATGGMDGNVCFWRVEGGMLLHRYDGDSPVLSLVWLPNAGCSAMFGTKNGNIMTIALMHDTDDFSMNGFWAHSYPIECLAAFDDRVASGAHGEVKIWRFEDLAYILDATLQQPPTTSQNNHQEVLVTSLNWKITDEPSPLLVVTYMFHGVHIFETTRYDHLRTISLQGKIASAGLSDNGDYLAVSNVDRGFDVYQFQSSVPLCSFNHDGGEPRRTPVLFIHGGKALVGGSVTGKVNIWDVVMGKMHTLTIPGRAKVLAVAAHYVPGPLPSSYVLRIATATFNEKSPSMCIIWQAEWLDTVVQEQPRKTAVAVEGSPSCQTNAGPRAATSQAAPRSTSLTVIQVITLTVVLMLFVLIGLDAIYADERKDSEEL